VRVDMKVKIYNNDIDRILGTKKHFSNTIFFDFYFRGMDIYSNLVKKQEHFEITINKTFLEEQKVGEEIFYLSKNRKFSLFLREDDWVFKEQKKP
jgi:hypothetical protein